MAEKNLLSWVGYKGDNKDQPTPSQNAVERIRELESQLSDLRSRRDITNLTREEFEMMATETAMQMIRSAQAREAKANATVQKLLAESSRSAKEKIESAEAKIKSAEEKAKGLLSSAENRGRKYIQAAEADAEEIRGKAEEDANSIINSKKREAATISAAARREAERLVSEATGQIANYRSWLGTAISEAERLHRIQNQSLRSAISAIDETQRKLDSAFEKLATLKVDVTRDLEAANKSETQKNNGKKNSRNGKKSASKNSAE